MWQRQDRTPSVTYWLQCQQVCLIWLVKYKCNQLIGSATYLLTWDKIPFSRSVTNRRLQFLNDVAPMLCVKYMVFVISGLCCQGDGLYSQFSYASGNHRSCRPERKTHVLPVSATVC